MTVTAQAIAENGQHLSDAPQGYDAAPTAGPDVHPRVIAAGIRSQLTALDLFQRLAAIRSELSGRVVFTTSFGLEDQAITHAIFSQSLAIDVATLDTGRLFPETYDVWAETERRYGTRVSSFAPERSDVEGLARPRPAPARSGCPGAGCPAGRAQHV